MVMTALTAVVGLRCDEFRSPVEPKSRVAGHVRNNLPSFGRAAGLIGGSALSSAIHGMELAVLD